MRRLAEIGVLDGPSLSRALSRLRARGDRAAWRLFAERALLFVGIGLVVAAVVFFFAANWGALTRGMRLGLALAAHVVAALVAARLGVDRVAGRAAAACAALLIGPALLTYGQAYQTGADAWQLFMGWTLLTVPFALAVRGTALWVVVLALFRVAAFLFADQQRGVDGDASTFGVATVILVTDAVAYALARRRGGPWLPTLIVAIGLCTVAVPLFAVIVGDEPASPVAMVLLITAIAAHVFGIADAVATRDLPRAALFCLSTALHVGFFAARLVFKEAHLDEGGLLLMSAFVLAEGSAVAWLLHTVLAKKKTVRT